MMINLFTVPYQRWRLVEAAVLGPKEIFSSCLLGQYSCVVLLGPGLSLSY
jgi:hypothetical protein